MNHNINHDPYNPYDEDDEDFYAQRLFDTNETKPAVLTTQKDNHPKTQSPSETQTPSNPNPCEEPSEASYPDDPHPEGFEPYAQNAQQSSPKKGHPRKLSEKTQATYLDHVKAIQKKLIASNPFEFERRAVSPTDMVDYLLGITHTIRPKTFSAYRSALIYWLNQQPQTAEVHHALLALNVAIPKYGFKGVRPGEVATLYSTRSQRKRSFRKKEFDKLIAELNRRSSMRSPKRAALAQNLLLWLQAGLATGLRPSEWETAYWKDKSKGILFVHTAKTKHDTPALPLLHDRAAPDQKTRIIPVDHENAFWVDQHLERVKNHLRQGQPFESYYNNLRTYLWNLNREIFGYNAFTLYMMRGQFAANMKGAGLKSEEVAELMGCSPYVVQANYGQKVHAHRASQYPQRQKTTEQENPDENDPSDALNTKI